MGFRKLLLAEQIVGTVEVWKYLVSASLRLWRFDLPLKCLSFGSATNSQAFPQKWRCSKPFKLLPSFPELHTKAVSPRFQAASVDPDTTPTDCLGSAGARVIAIVLSGWLLFVFSLYIYLLINGGVDLACWLIDWLIDECHRLHLVTSTS